MMLSRTSLSCLLLACSLLNPSLIHAQLPAADPSDEEGDDLPVRDRRPGRALAPAASFRTLTEDFLLNDDTLGGGSTQNAVAIAARQDGGCVLAWEDSRTGNRSIYTRTILSDGTPAGAEWRVNDDRTAASHRYPSLGAAHDGSIVIAWEDHRGEDYDIYAQRVSPAGAPLGPNIRIDDGPDGAYQYTPAVAVDSAGAFFVAWRGSSEDGVRVRYFDAAGNPMGESRRVNDSSGGTRRNPAAGIDRQGRGWIVWEDSWNTATRYDVMLQILGPDGAPLGGNVRVNDDTLSAYQRDPWIGVAPGGGAAVVWEDRRNGDYDIYLQVFDAAGTRIGNNVRVDDDSSGELQYDPGVAVNDSGDIMVVWKDERSGGWELMAQRFVRNQPAGSNFRVHPNADSGDAALPAVAMDAAGRSSIAWSDERTGSRDLFLRRVDRNGGFVGPEIPVIDERGSASQVGGSIAAVPGAGYLAAWSDGRNGATSVHAQVLGPEGQRYGPNICVAGDSAFYAGEPSVAGNALRAVIVWREYDAVSRIRLRWFRPDGTPEGPPVTVSDAADGFAPDVEMNGAGRTAVVWATYGSMLPGAVLLQMYDGAGIPVGGNVVVSDSSGALGGPAVAVDGTGNVLVVWLDGYDFYGEALGRIYGPDGHPLGPSFRISADSLATEYGGVSAAPAGAAGWVVCRVTSSLDVVARWFTPEGTPVSGSVVVTDGTGVAGTAARPAVAAESSGSVVIAWTDYRSGSEQPNIVAQRFAPGGVRFGGNTGLVENGPHGGERSPALAASAENIAVLWEDNRRAKGWDIYGKLVPWDWGGVASVREAELPGRISVGEAYPNPFNASAVIPLRLGAFARIRAAVYDLLGREVAVIADGGFHAGAHLLRWDAAGLASGTYVVRVTGADAPVTRKLMLLK